MPWQSRAYACSCNPEVEVVADWWELAHAEFGGDDFVESLDPHGGVFALIVSGKGDLEVSATSSQLSLQAVAVAPTGH